MAMDRKQLAEDGTPHYVSERQKRKMREEPPAIQPPLTPMIDVTFQLLIFFLLACTFRVTEGQIEATLPNISGPQDKPKLKIEPIKVTLSAAGVDGMGVLIEVSGGGSVNDPLELDGVLVQLREQYKSDEVPVLIKPTGDVWWTHVVDAFNQAVRSKFKNIAFTPPGM
ncbi:hypothetical protein LCGC14_1449210 [marine sediment metagenome]|uniref:Biopolymer transport protein ExbD/TolR n=1 Tax=marine sediment metagenome TaxID=412755 RepID=A0A0F9LYV5_9ZZZZ